MGEVGLRRASRQYDSSCLRVNGISGGYFSGAVDPYRLMLQMNLLRILRAGHGIEFMEGMDVGT